MSMVEQSESDDGFASGVKAKKFMVTGSSILLFLFRWKNEKCGSFHHGLLNFWHAKKNSQ